MGCRGQLGVFAGNLSCRCLQMVGEAGIMQRFNCAGWFLHKAGSGSLLSARIWLGTHSSMAEIPEGAKKRKSGMEDFSPGPGNYHMVSSVSYWSQQLQSLLIIMGREYKFFDLMERLSDNLWSPLIQYRACCSSSLYLACPELISWQTAMMKTPLIRRLTIRWNPKHKEATVVMIIGFSQDLTGF